MFTEKKNQAQKLLNAFSCMSKKISEKEDLIIKRYAEARAHLN